MQLIQDGRIESADPIWEAETYLQTLADNIWESH
jgi:hypothetical protein